MSYLQWQRLEEGSASAGQLLLRTFLVWPLLASLGRTFLFFSPWIIWVGALAIALVSVGACACLWQRRLNALEKRMRSERLDGLRRLVLGVLAQHALAADRAVASALAASQREITVLQEALAQQQAASVQRVAEIERLAALQEQRGPFIERYLYDLPHCNDWVREIVQREVLGQEGARERNNSKPANQRVSEVVRHTVRGELWGEWASTMIRVLATELGARELNVEQLAAIELCDKVPTLSGGQRWTWLYNRALPRAGAGLENQELTIVALGDPSDLAGASGRSSPEWGSEWQEARSRQPHRITMLRIVPLPDDCLAQSKPTNGGSAAAEVI